MHGFKSWTQHYPGPSPNHSDQVTPLYTSMGKRTCMYEASRSTQLTSSCAYWHHPLQNFTNFTHMLLLPLSNSLLNPHVETHLTPMKLKDIFIAGMGNRLINWHLPAAEMMGMMKGCVKSMCTYDHMIYKHTWYILCLYLGEVNFTSLNKHWGGSKIPHIVQISYVIYIYIWTTIYRPGS